MTPPQNQSSQSVQRLGRIRKHYSRASQGNMVLCGSLGVLYACYGDYLQAVGFWTVVGLSFAISQRYKQSTYKEVQRLSWLNVLLSLVILSSVLSIGPVLLGYLLPVILIVSSLSKRMTSVLLFFVFAISFVLSKWILGWDELLSIATPPKQALGLLTLISSALAWFIVDASRQRMQVHIATAQSSYEKIIAQNKVYADKQVKLSAINAELERLSNQVVSQAERERKLTTALMEKTTDQKSIVHAIHHDLREPLRNIVSFTQLIERKILGLPEAKEALDYLVFAQNGGRRMTKMLDDLLRYAKVVEGNFVPIELNSLLSKVEVDLAESIQRNQGVLTWEELPTINGLPTQIRQLFQNLISNALKFSEENQRVQVKISVETCASGLVNIHVSDNGIGIPESQLQSIFKLFNRANNSKEITGSGVGLSLCRKICLHHGANLRVISELGEGSTFSILGLELASNVESIDFTTTENNVYGV